MEVIEKTAPADIAAEQRDMRGTLTRVAVFALVTGIPLFMTNKYFNITLSKFLYFAIISALTFVLSYTLKPEGESGIKSRVNRPMDIAMLGFLGSSVISAAVSSYPGDALFGSSGRCMGVCFILLLAGLYRTVSRYYKIHKSELIGYIGAFSVVAFIAFLQFFGVNVLGLYNNISEATIAAYYSTIGNINVVSSYICLCLPFIMYAFCAVAKLWKRCLLFILCFTGFCFMVIANSDSGYIGMVAAFCAVAFFLTRKPEHFYRILILASVFLFSLRFVRTVSLLLDGRTKKLSPLAIMLGESDIVLIISVALMVFAVLFAVIRIPKALMSVVRAATVILPVVLMLALVGAIVYFTRFDTETDLGAFETYLRFNDKWATSRGHIWRMTMESYSDLPFIKKLFGCGPDTLLLLLKEKYEDEMLLMGAFTDNAHNEFMNYLVNNGIIGLTFYASIVIIALKNCIKKASDCWYFAGLFAVILSYACQSVVNISQPLTTPFFFIMMFMSCCSASKKEKTEKSGQ